MIAPEAQETADEVARAAARVSRGLAKADEIGVERTLFGRSGPGLIMSDLRTILSRLAVLEEERRLDGAAFQAMVSAIVPDSVTGGRSDLGIPAFGGFKPLAYARLQARKDHA